MQTRFIRLLSMLLLLSFLGAACQSSDSQARISEPGQDQPIPVNPGSNRGTLTLATTTSTQDSGLLNYLLPDFEAQYGVKVDVIAVGTGQALKLGEDGNVDVLLVHARAQEDQFIAAGHGTRREDVMYNDFVIIGPAGDPAGVRGTAAAAGAFEQLASAQARFISRGDNSGTHIKEKDIWQAAGIVPSGGWYISAGQGMGEVLGMADELDAYTLSDRATFLARRPRGLALELLVEGDPVLFNPYGVIAVDPSKNASIRADLAELFIEWLVSLPVQEKIAGFGMEAFGQSLFVPDSDAWRTSH
jgi:tungstate transport system substrate-binding protein